jgi:aldehyde:ferredoxin oxidoreductase
MKAINNQIGIVEISINKVKIEHVDDEVYKKFLGGYGLGVWYLHTHQRPNVDPLGPENTLGIISGLLNNTNIPMSGRFMAVAKSPLTGTWGDSNCGGHFGPKMMQAGLDGIFINGISKEPVYILIENGKISIHDATDLWGKTTTETEGILKNRHNGSEVLSIGPAGEYMSLISCIITDKGRALGRSGLGAVMGSKKVKAIVAVGNKKADVFDPSTLKSITKSMLNASKDERSAIYKRWHMYGTAGSNEFSALSGDTPIKNWNGIGIIDFGKENAKKLSGEMIVKDNVQSYGCASCPVACGAWIRRETRFGLIEGHRLEYEGASLFGQALLNSDLDSVAMSFELCNQYGLDIISTAAAIGFAMECFEKGMINERDVGFKLGWGDPDAIVKLVHMIGKGEGFGRVLGLGVKKAAEKIGKGADKIAIHVEGQELASHDPKYMPSLATTYLTDPTPGRHTAGGVGFDEGSVPTPVFNINLHFEKLEKYEYKNKGKTHAIMSNMTQVQNALGFCSFSFVFGTLPYTDMIKSATGLEYTPEELLLTGERIQDMRHLFNLREGLNPARFTIPGRAIGTEPQKDGPLKGITVDIDSMKREYYDAMGWDLETGQINANKKKELDLTY